MKHALLTLIVASLTLAGCASVRVDTDHNRSADFTEMRSFAWLEPAHDEVDDPMLDSALLTRKMHNATVSALTARGYLHVEPESADFLVTYHTSSRERISDTGPRVMIGVGGSRRRGHGSVFIGDAFGTRSWQEGTLIIDIIDAKSMELMWRGWSRGYVTPARFTDEAVHDSVTAILGKFPPGR